MNMRVIVFQYNNFVIISQPEEIKYYPIRCILQLTVSNSTSTLLK